MFYFLFNNARDQQEYIHDNNNNNNYHSNSYGSILHDPSLGDQSSTVSTLLTVGGDGDGATTRRKWISIDEAINDALAITSTTTTTTTTRPILDTIRVTPTTRLWVGTALLFLVDSMERTILAYLSRALDERVDWFHERYVAYVGLCGALSGAVVWGTMGDAWGRKRVTKWVSCIVTIFSIVTAFLIHRSDARQTTFHHDDDDGGGGGVNTIRRTGADTTNSNNAFMVEALLISRWLVGFGLGGITVPYDLLAEWLTNETTNSNSNSNGNNDNSNGNDNHHHHHHHHHRTKDHNRGHDPQRRAPALLTVHAFWSIGSLLVFGLLETQTILSPHAGQLTGAELWLCTVPAILATILFTTGSTREDDRAAATTTTISGSTTTTTPSCCSNSVGVLESPRFLLAQGKQDEALKVLRIAGRASGNHVEEIFPESTTLRLYSKESVAPALSTTTLTTTPPPSSSSSSSSSPWCGLFNLISWQWMKLASALLFTYLGQAFCYQATAAMLVCVFDEKNHGKKYQAGLSALMELVGIGGLILSVDRWGRVTTQLVSYATGSLACLTLAVWFSLPFLENGNVLICLALVTRTLLFGGGCVTWISTTEVLTTGIRTTGHAIAGMAGRIGALGGTLMFPDFQDIPLLALIIFGVSLAVAIAVGDIPETHMKEMGCSYALLGHSERWIRNRS